MNKIRQPQHKSDRSQPLSTEQREIRERGIERTSKRAGKVIAGITGTVLLATVISNQGGDSDARNDDSINKDKPVVCVPVGDTERIVRSGDNVSSYLEDLSGPVGPNGVCHDTAVDLLNKETHGGRPMVGEQLHYMSGVFPEDQLPNNAVIFKVDNN